jgi:homocysteine S-methyltransferase
VHLDYLRAGADCISTVSYQVSNLGYAELGRSAEDAAGALRHSVEIALAARDDYRYESSRPILIAVSLGPYGAALHNGAEFHGCYDIAFDELVHFHSERLAVVVETEADLIALETVPSLEEARAITVALAQLPSIAAWVSFTCRDESQTAHGEPTAECAALVEAAPQVVAVGVNCTQPRFISPLIGEIRSASHKPIFVYPNSGELWNAESRSWNDSPYGPSDIEAYARQARAWYAAGAHAVGGCCRTTPAHIRAIRENHPALVPE